MIVAHDHTGYTEVFRMSADILYTRVKDSQRAYLRILGMDPLDVARIPTRSLEDAVWEYARTGEYTPPAVSKLEALLADSTLDEAASVLTFALDRDIEPRDLAGFNTRGE